MFQFIVIFTHVLHTFLEEKGQHNCPFALQDPQQEFLSGKGAASAESAGGNH